MQERFETHQDRHKGRHVNLKVTIDLKDYDVLKAQVESMVENYNSYYGYVDYNDLCDDIRAMVKDSLKVYIEALDEEDNVDN